MFEIIVRAAEEPLTLPELSQLQIKSYQVETEPSIARNLYKLIYRSHVLIYVRTYIYSIFALAEVDSQ